ncbi:MAG: glycerol-3-phosphate 1-O-acyltransferase PlsY [Rhodocyclaceae bacterium]|nr:glycerol-3-phosphate 1-O-acyltransferase PlsY [Rhodocyclaceae bacterium]
MEPTYFLFAALAGYLLGSLPFAIIISNVFGLADPRSFGSGNPGATNVLRTGNKGAAALTLTGDILKGYLAVVMAAQIQPEQPEIIAIAGLAAFFGHLFPVFLKFKGGKGVATALGVMAGFSGGLALICVVVWLVVAGVTRYSSLAALMAAALAPLAAGMLTHREAALAVLVISFMLVLRHKANIQRLRAGTESRIGFPKT